MRYLRLKQCNTEKKMFFSKTFLVTRTLITTNNSDSLKLVHNNNQPCKNFVNGHS